MWTEFQSDSTQFIHIPLYLIELNLNQSNQKWYSINDYFRSKIYRNDRVQDRIHIILKWWNWIELNFNQFNQKWRISRFDQFVQKLNRIVFIIYWIELYWNQWNTILLTTSGFYIPQRKRAGSARIGQDRFHGGRRRASLSIIVTPIIFKDASFFPPLPFTTLPVPSGRISNE